MSDEPIRRSRFQTGAAVEAAARWSVLNTIASIRAQGASASRRGRETACYCFPHRALGEVGRSDG
jgi:hypothetical protein